MKPRDYTRLTQPSLRANVSPSSLRGHEAPEAISLLDCFVGLRPPRNDGGREIASSLATLAPRNDVCEICGYLKGREEGQDPDVYGCQERHLEGGSPDLVPSLDERVNKARLLRGVSKQSTAESSPEQERLQALKNVVCRFIGNYVELGIKSKRCVGAGFRGGNWNNDTTNSRVSDRNNAANVNTDRNNNNGARCAKTSPGTKTEETEEIPHTSVWGMCGYYRRKPVEESEQ